MNWFKEKWLKREKEIEKKVAHIHAQADQDRFNVQNQRLF